MEHNTTIINYNLSSISQTITVYYSILQYITDYYSILQYITVYYSILRYITVYYSITVNYSMSHYILLITCITVYYSIIIMFIMVASLTTTNLFFRHFLYDTLLYHPVSRSQPCLLWWVWWWVWPRETPPLPSTNKQLSTVSSC